MTIDTATLPTQVKAQVLAEALPWLKLSRNQLLSRLKRHTRRPLSRLKQQTWLQSLHPQRHRLYMKFLLEILI